MANTLEIIIKASDQASKTLLGVMDKTQRGFDSLGKNMLKTGAVMTGAAAPLAAVLVSSVKSAGQFEESMTNVGAVLGKTKTEMAGLSAEVLALGTTSRAGPQATAEAFYDIVGGVADASTHMAILNAAIATAEAGNAELGGTTSALISTMNAYGYSADQAAMVSDILTQTVGKGVGSMDEFAAAMPQVTSLAANLGIGFEDVGASMAFMTTKGFTASQTATQLKASMTALINPNEAMKSALNEIGFASGQAAIEQLGLAGTYQLLASESDTFESNMAGSVGSVEALQAVLSMTDEEFLKFVDGFKAGSEGATDAAREIQMSGFNAQLDLLRSNVEGLKIAIGTALLPPLNELLGIITPVVGGITEWAMAHPLLTRALGRTVGVLAALGTGLMIAGGAITLFGALLGALPLVALAVGFTAVTFAFDKFRESNSRLAIGLRSTVSALKAGSLPSALAMIDWTFQLSAGTARGWLTDIQESIAGGLLAFDNLLSGVQSKAAGISAAITTMWSELDLGGMVSGIADSVAEFDFSGLADGVAGAVAGALSSLTLDVGQIDFGSLGDQVSNHLLDILKIALPLVLGGGLAGVAVGAVVFAFQNDFLGFRTKLEESGVLTQIEDGLGSITDTISEFLSGGGATGGGGGKGGGDALSGLVSTLEGALQPLSDLVTTLAAPIAAGLGDLLDGLKGFFDAFKDTETGNIGAALGTLAEGLATIFGVFAVIGAESIGVVLSAIGNFLPALGEGISSLVTAVDRLIGGDFEGAFSALTNSITSLLAGFANYEFDLITGFIDVLLNLIGVDVEGLKTKFSDFGANMLAGIIGGLAALTADPFGWLNTNLINPLTAGLIDAGVSIFGAGAVDIAGNILLGIIDGLGDLIAWVMPNIIQPILDGISGAITSVYEGAMSLGGQILQGIIDALAGLPGEIMNIISGAIPGTLDLGPAGSYDINPFDGRAAGGPVSANVPYIVGERGPEMFVPQTAGRIIPNDDLTGGRSGGSSGASVYDMSGAQIILPNVTNARQFFDELDKEAKRRNRQLAGIRTGVS